MIPESFLQDLLDRVDIVDVVGRYVQLRKGGVNLLGLCPFHNEKSPSFTVSPTKQFYHCFGCGAHGTAIRFLMEHTAASFPEAVRILADSVGMMVPEESVSPRRRAEIVRQREEASAHTQVLEAALAHYQQQLRQTQQAIRYLKQRGVDGETAARFGLGWAGSGRQEGLSQVLAHYDAEALVETGLVIESEDGRRYDRFRDRIMFPIRNARGALVGFGGRIIGKGEPKYLNSPETPLFSKGNELYGLWENRQAIRSDAHVIVVEGYMDVVGLAQLGVGNAVATLGTATTPTHVQKLLRVSDCIVFSFDGDTAGRRAAWRALQACLPLLRDDVAIRFLFLPDAHDPDSYVREFGADAFRAYVAEATALSRFLFDELASRHRLDEAEGRAACAHDARPLIDAIPEGALRLQMQRELAQMVRLTPEELTALFASALPREHNIDKAMKPPPAEEAAGQDRRDTAGRSKRAASQGRQSQVVSRARRLARLVVTHPDLVENMGDQQLEMLDRSPHMTMVRDLIVLARSSGAKHLGGLMTAVESDSELADMLNTMAVDALIQEDLPDPQAEWEDALMRTEIDALEGEAADLAERAGFGSLDEPSRARFQELRQRLAVLKKGRMR